jgi:hypothetical protein
MKSLPDNRVLICWAEGSFLKVKRDLSQDAE